MLVLLPFVGFYLGAEYQQLIDAVQQIPTLHVSHLPQIVPAPDIATGLREPDFSYDGNVTVSKNFWVLIFEKPGAAALSQKLLFNDGTHCVGAGGVAIPCAKLVWDNGARVHVDGYETKSGGVVANFILK